METGFAHTYSVPSGMVLHAKARQHQWSGESPLSIKTFSRGQARYRVGRGLFAVGPQQYLILNHQQPYQIEVQDQGFTESFCLFFNSGFVEEVYRSLHSSSDQLLLEPHPSPKPALLFPERTYPHDDLLSPVLHQMQQNPSSGALEEQFHSLAERLLQLHFWVYAQMENLPAAKASTRQELYRRLHRAREYIMASYSGAVSLETLAQVTNLSPNHLLRNFKWLFGVSPHQLLTQTRLEQAQRLLAQTDQPISQICLEVGFESLGSFSTLFRQHFGLSPSEYRYGNRQTR